MITGLTLGMISSFHCVGMCGPLALSLPVEKLSGTWRRLAVMLYHAGRILTYATLGLIVGLLGRRIYIAGFQQVLSLSLGIAILFLLLWRRLSRDRKKSGLEIKWTRGLQQLILRLWHSPSRSTFFWLGMANGLLPCGMVYLAIAGALSLPKVAEGVLFMTLFGAGTLPALLLVSYSGHLISLTFRQQIKKAMPLFIAGMAILLILRGLNLGIPFISPLLAGAPGKAIICH